MSYFNITTYRLVSNNHVVSRIWNVYQHINPHHQELELKDLLIALDSSGKAGHLGSCGLVLSAKFSIDEETSFPILDLRVEGKGFPNISIFNWIAEVMKGSIMVNYRMEAPEVNQYLIHNEFRGFDEKCYVQGDGLFEALEGAYTSLDELFQGWSDETGQSLDGMTCEEKIAFINSFNDYESDDDFLFIHPYVQE